MSTNIPPARRALAATFAAAAILAACGTGAATTMSSSQAPANAPAASVAATAVLPVSANPIANTATAQGLKVDSVLVENNVDAAGKAANDHLEIAVTNTSSSELAGFEVYYTFTDPTAGTTESYYTKLPDSFTVPAGGSRSIHFDNTGAPDHFAVNEFSLYYTSLNALDLTVEVSAHGVAPQTVTVKKDAGGAETPD